MPHHQLADRSSEDPLLVQAGDSLELRVRENPSTGFRWVLDSSGEPACTLIEDRFQPGQRPGEPGMHVYRWSADRAGRCAIELRLRRPWDPPKIPPRQQIDVTVIVGA